MKAEKKILLVVVLASLIGQLFTILYYEQKLNKMAELASLSTTLGAVYTNESVIALIRSDSLYQGDSIWIDKKNRIRSNDTEINSTIDQMYVVEANFNGINYEAATKNLPVPFVVYKTAVGYYLDIYKNKNKQKPQK